MDHYLQLVGTLVLGRAISQSNTFNIKNLLKSKRHQTYPITVFLITVTTSIFLTQIIV